MGCEFRDAQLTTRHSSTHNPHTYVLDYQCQRIKKNIHHGL